MINYPHFPIEDTVYTGTWKTNYTGGCHHCDGACLKKEKIPVYTVLSANGLNSLVGHVKSINAGNGTVLCRGQCKLYENIRPSIYRNSDTACNEKTQNLDNLILKMIQDISEDNDLMDIWDWKGIVKQWSGYQALAIESMLQHYGASTRCVDFVDNHWVALWFGLHKCKKQNDHNVYEKRDPAKSGDENKNEKDLIILKPEDSKGFTTIKEDLESNNQDSQSSLLNRAQKIWNRLFAAPSEHPDSPEKSREKYIKYEADNAYNHMYLFLYVAETNHTTVRGISFGEHTYVVDLRKVLPYHFLRPCAQQGWVVRGKKDDYRFEDRIACVVRISVKLASDMLGNGDLTKIESLFPSEYEDLGYLSLLQQQIGSGVDNKLEYKQIIPEGTIDLSFMKKNRQK